MEASFSGCAPGAQQRDRLRDRGPALRDDLAGCRHREESLTAAPSIGKFLIGWYLGTSNVVASSYGAAASLITSCSGSTIPRWHPAVRRRVHQGLRGEPRQPRCPLRQAPDRGSAPEGHGMAKLAVRRARQLRHDMRSGAAACRRQAARPRRPIPSGSGGGAVPQNHEGGDHRDAAAASRSRRLRDRGVVEQHALDLDGRDPVAHALSRSSAAVKVHVSCPR